MGFIEVTSSGSLDRLQRRIVRTVNVRDRDTTDALVRKLLAGTDG